MYDRMNFTYVIYNANDPDLPGNFSNDLFDLFGSPDGHLKGFVYSKLKSDHKRLRWDWGINGFRNVSLAYYFEKYKNLKGFDFFYNRFLKGKSLISELIKFPIKAIYQVKPKFNSSLCFPAFLMEIHNIEKVENRLFLTFSADSYFIVDPKSWKSYLALRNNFDNWKHFCDDLNILNAILKSSAQSQHRIYPLSPFNCDLTAANTFLYKKLDLSDRKQNERDILDNQIFWNMYQYFTNQHQVSGNASFAFNSRFYEIKRVPSNSLSEANAVFKQEIGSLKAICSSLSQCFEDRFISIDFGLSESIDIKQSKFIKRAYQIKNFAHFDKLYENTDYDYVIDLRPVGIKKLICLDLTVGLWNKGRNKTVDEYLNQWKHNITLMPKFNSEIITVFYFGINEKPESFLKSQSSFKNLSEFICDIANNNSHMVFNGKDSVVTDKHQSIFLPFCDKDFAKELDLLMDSPRDSLLGNCLTKLFTALNTVHP
jgi:hypothetical protein